MRNQRRFHSQPLLIRMLNRQRTLFATIVVTYLISFWLVLTKGPAYEKYVEPVVFPKFSGTRSISENDELNSTISINGYTVGSEKLFQILSDQSDRWIFNPTAQYSSTPYLTTEKANNPSTVSYKNIIGTAPKKIISDTFLPSTVVGFVDETCKTFNSLSKEKRYCMIFKKSFLATLLQDTVFLSDETSFVTSGRVNSMSFRNSTIQVLPYLRVAANPFIQRLIEGLIARQMFFIKKDPFGNEFRYFCKEDITSEQMKKGINFYSTNHAYTAESLCWPIILSYKYWKATENLDFFDKVINKLLTLLIIFRIGNPVPN